MKSFQVLIKPAGPDCNLDCDYCFYKRASSLFPGKSHRMSRETLRVLIQDLLSERFPVTVFCWQGGEPTLMGLDFFQEAIELEKKAGVDGQVVGNSLQTNGVLIDEAWCKFMAQYQFLVGLSLDGPQEIHDSYRKGHGSLSSWAKAMDAAKRMQDAGVEFNILCVLNDRNVVLGAELYQWFLDQGFQHLQFISCVEAGMGGQGVAPFTVTPEQYGRFLCDVFDVWQERDFGKVCVRTFDTLLMRALQGRTTECTFGRACHDYLVVEHNGDVFPCDFFVTDPMRLGNIHEARIRTFFNSPIQKAFSSGKMRVAKACQPCRWYGMCYGGCQKDRQVSDMEGRSYLCEGYKIFFEHAWERMSALAKTLPQEPQAQRQEPSAQEPGRNDPCPCGSGLKYKRCCGR